MSCGSCGSKRRVANPAPSSGLVIADATGWLRFPKRIKPPGGWDVVGLPATSPEDAADKLAARMLGNHTFTTLTAVYAAVNAEYCSRPGSPCYGQ